MRASFIIAAFAVASVIATPNVKRQEEPTTAATEPATTEPATTGSTIIDSSPGSSPSTTASAGGSSASQAAAACQSPCDAATTIYSSCHSDANSLQCFCQSSSINNLAACSACLRSNGDSESANARDDQLGGIIAACNSGSISVASPSQVTITRTASVGSASQITAPPARASGASASGSKSASGNKSASGSGASPSASARGSNGANGAQWDLSLAGVLGAAGVALFL